MNGPDYTLAIRQLQWVMFEFWFGWMFQRNDNERP
jgi:hypothetical protein